ncbi:unnamed protein product [Staurois parvus]|uniref:Secreted protein n=1 Tax=Staurois parvus TaxID=386267 RepID=A0ABN9DFC5_9NEOB|nr:unnamed protein product [Staurois parvus]
MYVKWFDTVMLYYVILVYLVNVTFCHFQISRQFRPPYVPTFCRVGTRKTDAGIPPEDHYRGHCRREIAGEQDKVREEQIPEQQCRMVSPSVAQGYRLCYTREYR